MKLKCVALSLTIGWTIATSAPAVPHHSFAAEYDTSKPITVTGYVTKLDWVNPHAFLYLDTKDESGAVRSFKIEMGPPYALVRGGWSRSALKVGDRVTVEGAARSKDGGDAAGAVETTAIILANGQKLTMR